MKVDLQNLISYFYKRIPYLETLRSDTFCDFPVT